jgi:hypothetical protein
VVLDVGMVGLELMEAHTARGTVHVAGRSPIWVSTGLHAHHVVATSTEAELVGETVVVWTAACANFGCRIAYTLIARPGLSSYVVACLRCHIFGENKKIEESRVS